jgi:hypothetical protein
MVAVLYTNPAKRVGAKWDGRERGRNFEPACHAKPGGERSDDDEHYVYAIAL